MSKQLRTRVARAAPLAALCAAALACGSGDPSPDAGAPDAGRADADTDSQLRDDTCRYWPLDPGPSCGESIYGSERACLEAIEPCDDRDLLGIGYCWESGDERCDPSCLPECAGDP